MNTRDRLRTETKAIHETLDEIVASLEPFSSAQRYRVYLSAMDQLYDVFAEDIDSASEAAGLPCSVLSLRSAIRVDLDGNILESAAVERDKLTSDDLKKVSSHQWAVGYVMEGSAMGARYMAKMAKVLVEKSDEKIGNSYLDKLAADSYERWPAFVEKLNQAQCDDEFAVAAASSVFETAVTIFNGFKRELVLDSK